MNKTILILGAGIEQTLVIEQAKKMGLRVIAMDANPSAPGLKEAHIGINSDITDVDKVAQIGRNYRINGIMTHGVEVSQTVSAVAKKLRLPGLDPVIAERATNKQMRAECFRENGISYPRFSMANTLSQTIKEAKKIRFPVVIKPVDNSAARGVKKIYSTSDLEKSYEETLYFSSSKTIIIEEYLEGHEISTESFVYKGAIITTGFADRNYSKKKEFSPYFVEDGHSVPSIFSPTKRRGVIKEAEKAIKALGIDWGIAKGDILINKDKAYILEMATRTSGGWFAAGTVPIATGVNIVKPLIKITVGENPTEDDFRQKFEKAACQRYIIPTENGVFEKFEGVQSAKKMHGVVMLDIFKHPEVGKSIHKAQNNGERFGHLIAEGKDLVEAVRRAENARERIKIVLKN